MDTETLLDDITTAAEEGSISERQLLSAFRKGKKTSSHRRMTIIDILYAVGGIIVVLGIVLFFQQQWKEMSSAAKILVTLGSGIATYLSGVLLSRAKGFSGVATAFFLIFALVSPFGIFITLDTLHYDSPLLGYENIIFGLMTAWVALSFLTFHLPIFRVFSIIFGSFLFFSATGALLERNPAISLSKAFEYRFLFLGISYGLLAYGWKKAAPILASWMYALGTAMFLGAAMALGGYGASANKPWEIAYVGLNFGVMFISIAVKSRAMLVLGALYLMGYIIKITAEYFSDSLGWPISLVIAGFALIAIGYGTFVISGKYLKKKG